MLVPSWREIICNTGITSSTIVIGAWVFSEFKWELTWENGRERTVNCVGRCSLENRGKHAHINSLWVRTSTEMQTEQSYSQLSGLLTIIAEVKKLKVPKHFMPLWSNDGCFVPEAHFIPRWVYSWLICSPSYFHISHLSCQTPWFNRCREPERKLHSRHAKSGTWLCCPFCAPSHVSRVPACLAAVRTVHLSTCLPDCLPNGGEKMRIVLNFPEDCSVSSFARPPSSNSGCVT